VSEPVEPLDEPVLTPEAALVLQEIETAAAAVGFPIHGYAKLNAVSDTLVGPDDAPLSLGPSVELAVSIASDGVPLPPPGQRARNESAAAIMIIRVAPERSFGTLCWRAWVNLVDVGTARAFYSHQSIKADDQWAALTNSSVPTGDDSLDLDERLDEAMANMATLTSRLPRTAGDAIAQAFAPAVHEGQLSVGRQWDPLIKRPPRLLVDEAEHEGAPSDPTESEPPVEDSQDSNLVWYSSFALAGIAATVGLVIGLAILWAGGQATAGSHDTHERPLMDQLLTGTAEDGTAYDRILAFQIGAAHFPVSQFSVAQPYPGCSVEHVRLATVELVARSLETPALGIYDPDPTGCGFGTLESLQPAPYPISHEQVHTFCTTYRRETPDWLNTPTTALCESRAPDADH
jgi:hypothetical protein